jgi:hypothetical protein
MANSYVFRKIDGDLWRQARAKCLARNLKFLDVIESYLRAFVKPDDYEAQYADKMRAERPAKG